MKIRYLGHSCFVLSTENVRFVTDPFSGIGIPMPRVQADAVTVSHAHFDHNCIGKVDAPVVLDRAGKYDVCGIPVGAAKCYHDDAQGKKRGENLIFRFFINGLNVCHLGDVGEACSERLIGAVTPVDVLLIPVGGTYTIGAEQAKEFIERSNPKIVIPMHYKARGIELDIAPLDDFLNLFPSTMTERRKDSEIELTADGLPDRTKIIVLERYEYGSNQ